MNRENSTAESRQAQDYCQQLEKSFIGSSKKIAQLKKLIKQIAPSDLTVLIHGETGTGKEVVARLVHQLSQRCTAPFIKVNCAAIPDNLLEAELFGYEQGAYTGAHQNKPGRLEFAHTGSLFLDEIGEMNSALQSKLLQAIEEKTFFRLGAKVERKVDIRIIAATNRSISRVMEEGCLRADLFYRLNEINIHLPPLRERKEDIPLLLEYFLRKYCSECQYPNVSSLPAGLLNYCLSYDWPGNVRELENLVKRWITLGFNDEFLMSTLSAHTDKNSIERETNLSAEKRTNFMPSLRKISKEASVHAEREAILMALNVTRWNRTEAAKLLQVSYRGLLSKLSEIRSDEEPVRN